jgi:RNA polymerase sigma factor (sigma-70 family)
MMNIPALPKRQTNTEKFFTYLILNSNTKSSSLQWKNQPNLQRNIRLYEEMNDKFRHLCNQKDKGDSLAQFWREVVLSEEQAAVSWEPRNKKQLGWEHLANFFEEKCYWTARDLCKDRKLETWEEFFFLARLIVYNPLKLKNILDCYNPYQTNMDSYVSQALANYVKSETKENKFSRWRLIYNKSDKELKEALQVLGRKEPEISQFIFARKYFKEVYLISKVKNPARRSGQRWLDPDAQDFEQSARCYNAEKLSKSAPYEVSVNLTKVTGIEIQQWMEVCIQALEQYPKSILPQFSLEELELPGFQRKYQSIKAIEEIESEKTSLTEEISSEEFDLSKRINSDLSENLIRLKADDQKILLLYYGFGFNQKQLAEKLGINQSTISRCISKSTYSLINKMSAVSQPQLWARDYVETWLKKSYQTPIHSDIIQASLVFAVKNLSVEERQILQNHSSQAVEEKKLDDIISRLQDSLLKNVDDWIKKYIDKWLTKYYEPLAQSILRNANYTRKEDLETETIISLVKEYLKSLNALNIK